MKRTVAALAFGLVVLGGSQAMAAGALAIDTNQGDRYGFSHGYATSGEAIEGALSECGGGCQVVLQIQGECGAYAADQASGSTVYGWATAASESEAQSHALSECQSHGGTSCIVRVWACD